VGAPDAVGGVIAPELMRVRNLVLGLPVARLLGFSVGHLAPGTAEIVQPEREELTQADGFVQAGVLGTLADIAAGCAAGTLLPSGWVNLTVDYTVKIVAPAHGEIIARGRVVQAGRSTSVAAADLYTGETLCVTALVTLRNIRRSAD
jgi:uncharacterized protein (TIGR00369 family)